MGQGRAGLQDRQVSQNETDIEAAKTAIALAEIDLEKYVGLPKGTLGQPQARGRPGPAAGNGKEPGGLPGEAPGRVPGRRGRVPEVLDDWNGQIELADADVEMWKDRVAYSQRMQLKGYLSPSQVQADESRLAGARETLKKVKSEKQLLQSFTAQAEVKTRSAKVQEAWRALDRVVAQATAKEVQAENDPQDGPVRVRAGGGQAAGHRGAAPGVQDPRPAGRDGRLLHPGEQPLEPVRARADPAGAPASRRGRR